MPIKVIVELRAKPGRRADLKRVLENMIATHGPGQHGFLGSRHYEVLDDADLLVEIADWESAEARSAHAPSRRDRRLRTPGTGEPVSQHGVLSVDPPASRT